MQTTAYGFPRFRVVKDKLTGLYKCHLCSYKSVYGSSLRSHFAVHSNARPYGCDLCSYEAKRLPDLKKHKILKHIRKNHSSTSALSNKNPLQVFRDPGSGLYRCQHCSYQSDNPRCVRSHLAVHSHLRPYACDTCDYQAKRSSDLSKHKIIKHGRVPTRRNKPRKRPAVEPTTSTSEESQKVSSPVVVVTTKPEAQQDLDRCDVLTDLDYSMMSPTRAALEALRRCNMMEPLDMFNEYSNPDPFQHNPVFPEPENPTGENPTYSSKKLLQGETEGRPSPVHYNTLDSYPQSHIQEVTVFVKPEPPDDYFEEMKSQKMNTQQALIKTKVTDECRSEKLSQQVAPLQVCMEQDSENCQTQHSETSPAATGERSKYGAGNSENNNWNGPSQGPRNSAAMDTNPGGTKPFEAENTEKFSIHLERRNVTGSSLIRPVMPNPRPAPDVERTTLESSTSRESGYSSPGISSGVLQSLGLKSEMESTNTKMTNTRKSWSCQHCDIVFFDGALYFMHMGLHNSDDPWRCNMCCAKFYDVYGFTSHFVNGH